MPQEPTSPSVEPEAHPFLSDPWIEGARALRQEYADRISPSPIDVRVNVVITGSPHHEGDIDGMIDSTGGEIMIERGHLDDPELTVTVDYETALTVFVTREPQAMMEAFLGGKIMIEGDATKLMALQAQPPSADATEMFERLDAMTTH